MNWDGLGWTGLDWAGLGWTGLDWAGLGWAGLDWVGLGWTGLDWDRMDEWAEVKRLDLPSKQGEGAVPLPGS
jgi:hypothetical protein